MSVFNSSLSLLNTTSNCGSQMTGRNRFIPAEFTTTCSTAARHAFTPLSSVYCFLWEKVCLPLFNFLINHLKDNKEGGDPDWAINNTPGYYVWINTVMQANSEQIPNTQKYTFLLSPAWLPFHCVKTIFFISILILLVNFLCFWGIWDKRDKYDNKIIITITKIETVFADLKKKNTLQTTKNKKG